MRLLCPALDTERDGSQVAEPAAPCSLGRESSRDVGWAPAVPLPAPAPNPGSSWAAEGLAQREHPWAQGELAAGAATTWSLLLPWAARLPWETCRQTPRTKSLTAAVEWLQRSFPTGVAKVYSVPACYDAAFSEKGEKSRPSRSW